MMSATITIAIEEWRYWSRTKLGAAAAVLALILVCISVFASLSQQAQEKNTRESMQVKAGHGDVLRRASPEYSNVFTKL